MKAQRDPLKGDGKMIESAVDSIEEKVR